MDLYFAKFPQIYYSNTLCKDISRRVKISTQTRNLPNIYYPYSIEEGVRADNIADAYYKDSYQDWLIYLTNGIVDPYYGWHLDEDNFNKLIIEKYGSIEAAQKRIKFYRTNWYNDDIELPVTLYENNLLDEHKKYYVPVFGNYSKVVSYKRREEDWTISTNQIIRFDVTYNSNTSFIKDELVDLYTGVNVSSNNGVEVVQANSTTVTLKNISGNTSIGNYIVGETSGANATITAIDYIANNIATSEKRFWSPVYYYEYEQEKNEANKHLLVIDKNYALNVSEEIRQLLKITQKDLVE